MDGYEDAVNLTLRPLLRTLNGLCETLKNIITKNFLRNYDTISAIQNLVLTFEGCVNALISNIKVIDDLDKIRTIQEDILKLLQNLSIKVYNSSQRKTSLGSLNALFIGIEKEKPSFFTNPLGVDCHSLKLFDDFINTLIDGINSQKIIISGYFESIPSKRLFLFLREMNDSYKKKMDECRVPSCHIPSQLLNLFIQSGLSREAAQKIPCKVYDEGPSQGQATAATAAVVDDDFEKQYQRALKAAEEEQLTKTSRPSDDGNRGDGDLFYAGGYKSRRKRLRKTRRGRGRGRKSNPSTYKKRRNIRRYSRSRKHKNTYN